MPKTLLYEISIESYRRILTCTCILLQVIDKTVWFTVPDQWTMEEASTVPVVYLTAYYALCIRAQLRRNESVLIHSGSGKWYIRHVECWSTTDSLSLLRWRWSGSHSHSVVVWLSGLHNRWYAWKTRVPTRTFPRVDRQADLQQSNDAVWARHSMGDTWPRRRYCAQFIIRHEIAGIFYFSFIHHRSKFTVTKSYLILFHNQYLELISIYGYC